MWSASSAPAATASSYQRANCTNGSGCTSPSLSVIGRHTRWRQQRASLRRGHSFALDLHATEGCLINDEGRSCTVGSHPRSHEEAAVREDELAYYSTPRPMTTPDRYVDHWVVEYWEPELARWRRVDNQLDQVQQDALTLDFDPTDVPAGKFLDGAEAWQMCRAGAADPERFGILDFWGLWFVRNNVVRDLAALNKMELLPWDGWGLMNDEQGGGPASGLVDRVAQAIVADDWLEIRRLYDENDLLR